MELTVEWKGALLRLTKGDLMKALLNLTESELVAMEDTTPLVPVLRVEGYVPGNAELSKTCFLDIRMALVRRDHPLHGHSMHDFWASARCDTEVRSVVSSPVHQPLSWSVSNGLNQKQEPDDPTCLTFGHTDDQIASDDESMTETHVSIHSSHSESGQNARCSTAIRKIAGTRLFIRVYRGAGLRFPSALVLDHQKNAHRVFVTCRLAKQRIDTPVAVESLPNPEWDYRDFSVRDMIFDVFKQCENFEFKIRMKHNTGDKI
ncbi:hypothetical protein SARC_08720 [Sphaeroforma arctica JP610]|uniref:C2 domain-containing protein n=1 Tax=Sphaeroforma arctica JP610 TaxID=667725 RepID=A0A0L0FPX8_9EUKA|nr:hypothetical protein SARC_08720 [Sphaeroforma arctica JP610]KNC78865.1 hypothetical protein SARC_08720 [Sphaeroforma arctica JP610]|eukprot:XP_014152767.1 hypothetical protein SARC_08720 [Sphaeroforma arctica JP610]